MDDLKLRFDDLSLIQMSHLVSYNLGEKGDEAVILEIINSSGKKVTTNNLKMIIKDVFKVEIDQIRIGSAIQKLKSSDKIYEQNGEILISPLFQGEIYKLLKSSSEVESLALEEWAKCFEEKYEIVLSESEKCTLFDTINKYIKTVFLRHGATSYRMITSSLDSLEAFDLKDIISSIISDIPTDQKQYIRDFLFYNLFNYDISNEQRTYLRNQISKAVCYISMVASPEFLSTINAKVEKVTVYLDTSIIYRLLNLQGEEHYESSKELVRLCYENNIKLKIFKKTYTELCHSIGRYSKEIIKYSTPVIYNELSYKIRSTDNYISAFWNESSRNGVSATDFNNKYKNLLPHLNSFSIEIDDIDYSSIYEVKYLSEEYQVKIRQHESTDPTEHKSIPNLEHDAFCMASVRALQFEYADNILDAKFMFLTSDRVLIKLQHSAEFEDLTPIAILPSQLMQMLCFTKPTTTYFDAFVGFFSSSKTYFGYDLSNSNINEIVGRISLYSKDATEIVEEILSNQIVQNVFKSVNSGEQEKDLVLNEALTKELENLLHAKRETEVERDKIIYEKEAILRKNAESDSRSKIKLEESTLVTEKIKDELDKTQAEKEYLSTFYLKSADSYASRKALCHSIRVYLMIAPPFIIIIFYLFAIFPFTSFIVKPVLDYLKTSLVFTTDDGYGQIINMLLPIISVAVSAIMIFRTKVPKYIELKNKYKIEFLDKNKFVYPT